MRHRAAVVVAARRPRRRRRRSSRRRTGWRRRARSLHQSSSADDVGLVAREGDDVGRVGEVAREGAHDVAERLAVGVAGAVERRRSSRARRARPAARRAAGAARSRRCAAAPRPSAASMPKRAAEQRGDPLLLLGGRPFALAAPAPELAPPLAHGVSVCSRTGRGTTPAGACPPSAACNRTIASHLARRCGVEPCITPPWRRCVSDLSCAIQSAG